MGKLYLKKYQNKNSKNAKAYGKWFLRAKHVDTLNIQKLSAHIAKHGSIYTYDVILGVITRTAECIAELVQEGNKVKLDGLGTFYLSVTSQGVNKSEDLNEDHVVLKHLRFFAERSQWSDNATTNMTRMARVTTKDPYADNENAGNNSNSGGNDNPTPGGAVVEDEP